MLYIQLFIVFFKIGLFSFGGGIAMLPIIQKEVLDHSWLTLSEFMKIVGISQVTPGPIAVNTSTFVGLKAGGILGAVVATTALSLPSIIIMILISSFLMKVQNHPIKINIFLGIKSVSIALIVYAAYSIGAHSFLSNKFNIMAPILFFAILVALRKTKIHPIFLIIISGFAGYLFL
jgi:chromate transporter